jgi:hypothetical protein
MRVEYVHIVTTYGVTIDGVLDLLTTYTHDL